MCIRDRLLSQNVVTGCTVMVNRALLDLAAPWPEAAVMHDWYLALVAACFGQIGLVEEATIDYRQHERNQVGKMCIRDRTTARWSRWSS